MVDPALHLAEIPLAPAELQLWLEWAGMKLLSLDIRSPFPAGPKTAWPSFAQDVMSAYGYTNERLRPAVPNRFEIDLMDELLRLPPLATDITARRIVQVRTLVTPVSNRYLYSWTKISHMLHTSNYIVIRKHKLALREIVGALAPEKAHTFRRSIAPYL